MPKEITGKLVERVKRTPTIESFRFIPGERIDFIPGQFLQVIFDKNDLANKELNKYLSFSSAPTKDYIEITKRLSRSKFSQKLTDLKAGDEILFKAPLGNCVFKRAYRKVCFLIGGIGITPVISIIEHIMDTRLDTDVLLFYCNKTEDEIAFRKELDNWSSLNKNIKICYCVTACEPEDKRCVFGRINKDLLSERIEDPQERVFFMFGPPKMVEAMKTACFEIGCREENTKTERFIGY